MFSSYILCINTIQNPKHIKCTSYKTLEEAEQNVQNVASYIIYPVMAPTNAK
jgi:hypothetical protein